MGLYHIVCQHFKCLSGCNGSGLQFGIQKGAGLSGADVPFSMMVPQLLISICAFPLSAWLVSRFDVWRLGR